jgi:hypothetical protein
MPTSTPPRWRRLAGAASLAPPRWRRLAAPIAPTLPQAATAQHARPPLPRRATQPRRKCPCPGPAGGSLHRTGRHRGGHGLRRWSGLVGVEEARALLGEDDLLHRLRRLLSIRALTLATAAASAAAAATPAAAAAATPAAAAAAATPAAAAAAPVSARPILRGGITITLHNAERKEAVQVAAMLERGTDPVERRSRARGSRPAPGA